MFEIRDNSIYLPQIDLYLDSRKKQNYGFVSHAHADHLKKHNKIICTPQTMELAKLRIRHTIFETIPFFTRKKIKDHTITLIPAGHILGSAQIYIENGNTSLLYTGDFKTKVSRTAEKFIHKKSDILIMETTFGRSRYHFPPRKEMEDMFVIKLRENLSRGLTPVIFCYSLGKSQEILHLVSNKGLPVAVDYPILQYAKIYEKFGVKFGKYEKFKKSEHDNSIIILPVNMIRESFLSFSQKYYKYFVSGWGVDENAAMKYGVHEVIPISDHADYYELIDFVEKVKPKKVYCTHGFEDFYKVLRGYGFDAYSLRYPEQYELF